VWPLPHEPRKIEAGLSPEGASPQELIEYGPQHLLRAALCFWTEEASGVPRRRSGVVHCAVGRHPAARARSAAVAAQARNAAVVARARNAAVAVRPRNAAVVAQARSAAVAVRPRNAAVVA
jgi:hypothetical protein